MSQFLDKEGLQIVAQNVVKKSSVGKANGVASLNSNGKVIESQLPDAIKNPNALTIISGDTTVVYDGSEAKEITVEGGGGTGNVDSIFVNGNTYSPDTEGKVTLPNYPTSLPASDVSDWAKANTKPTYTASEVGALPSDTPIPSEVTEETVSGWGFTKNTGTYSKPSSGIPKTDLANDIQTSLGKADTALQDIPIASTITLGGVKVDGSSIKINNGVISASSSGEISFILNDNNLDILCPSGRAGGTTYTLNGTTLEIITSV